MRSDGKSATRGGGGALIENLKNNTRGGSFSYKRGSYKSKNLKGYLLKRVKIKVST